MLPHPQIGHIRFVALTSIHSKEAGTLTLTNDITARADHGPPTEPSSGPGTTTQAMKDAVKRPTAFDRFADWVSEAMGRPLNIAFWFVLIVVWTLVFALGGTKLSSGNWLPSWFTSQGYNFPLNLITTVAELFIGFLVATASNRAQNALTALLDKIDTQEQQIGATEANIVRLIEENALIISEIHALATQVARDTALINEVHRHVSALTTHFGLHAGDFPPDASQPPAVPPA
jgi:low affinity Fe/Cu permease